MSQTELSQTGLDKSFLVELEATAVRLARGAGRILNRHFGTEFLIEYKDKAGRDPVTEVDKKCQNYISRGIAKKYPGHIIIGEEDPRTSGLLDKDLVWVVDPLDGTKNFVSGFPMYACSIGVLSKGVPVVGAIYIPSTISRNGLLFHAHSGGGAYVDSIPLSVFQGDYPDPGGLITLPAGFASMSQFQEPIRRLTGDFRVTGSITFELAMTANGTSQYSIIAAPKLWDVVAGVLIIMEAGGVVKVGRTVVKSNIFGKPKYEWDQLTSFFNSVNCRTTIESMRRWSHPLVAGNPQIVQFVTRNLKRGAFHRK